MLKFCQARLGTFISTFGLFVQSAEFLFFEANNNLSLFDFVAFLDADPRYAPGDFRVDVNLVMGDNVPGSGKHSRAPARIARFRSSARRFDFRRVGGEHPVSQRSQSQQYDQGDPAHDEASRPGRRFAAAVAHGMIDAQVL